MPIKAVIFDLDDTLYPYCDVNKLAQEKVAVFLSEQLQIGKNSIIQAMEVGRGIVHAANQGLASSHSRLLYFQKAIESLTGYTNVALTLHCEELFWQTFLNCMQLFPDVKECLIQIKASWKLKILILTDLTTQIQLRKLIQLDIDEYIDWVVSSEEVGAEKPDVKMFSSALAKLKAAPDEVVMIGDNFEKDCLGAQAAGIKQVIWKSRMASSEDILIADSFLDITKILRTIV